MYPSTVAITITSCLAIIAYAAPANNTEASLILPKTSLQKDGNTNADIGSNHMMERGFFGGKSKDKKKDKKDKDKDGAKDGDEGRSRNSHYKAKTAAEFCRAYKCTTRYDTSCKEVRGELLNLEKVQCDSCVQILDGSFRCAP